MEELKFVVFAVGATWGTYAAAKTAAIAHRDTLNAHYGDYTYIAEYHGGQATPNETKVSVAFMDPTDLAIAPLPAGTTTITELDWANDSGWPPPVEVIGQRADSDEAKAAQAASKTILGKRLRKLPKKK
jgi:hypothetical protein